MKNLYKLLFTVLSVITFSGLSAQSYRIIDLSNTMISPDSGFQFVSPDSLGFSLSIKNQGPDTVLSVDTFSIQCIVQDNEPRKTWIYIPVSREIFPGDSILLNFKIWVDVFDYNHFILVTCYMGLVNRHPNYTIQTEVIPGSRDNTASAYIFNQNKLNGIGNVFKENTIKLWPNPANTQFHLSIDNLDLNEQAFHFVLYNQLGQEVKVNYSLSDGQYNFTLPKEISPGTYFLRGIGGTHSFHHKIQVK